MPDSTDALTILFETLLKNPPSWFNNAVYFVTLLGLALIFAIDRPLDMCRTVVNVTSDCTIATIVAKSVGKLKTPENF